MTAETPSSLLDVALKNEAIKFKECYQWLEQSMPPLFFEEVGQDNLLLVAHSLMGFDLQEFFCQINLKKAALVLCLDSAHADLKILEDYTNYGIKNYLTFVSNSPPPFEGVTQNLRIGLIHFTDAEEVVEEEPPPEALKSLKDSLKVKLPDTTEKEIDELIESFNGSFLRALNLGKLTIALAMCHRAQTRDTCQYELYYNEEWEKNQEPSLNIVLAWRNTPKYGFLYKLALAIHRHGLIMKGVSATYLNPYSKDSILVMSLGLHGASGEAAWEACDIGDFLRELMTTKYFAAFDLFDRKLVAPKLITGLMGHLLRAATQFIHQSLVHVDKNLFTEMAIEEAFCTHPELTQKICHLFYLKFHPDDHDFEAYLEAYHSLKEEILHLDTGDEENDLKWRTILIQAANMAHFTYKTNLWRQNYTALSFRLDPAYLNELPFDRSEKFPELPYAIFFIKGLHYFGFHIRFRDLARGGLRTVLVRRPEMLQTEQRQIFSECYHLAYTQNFKNKDIPEGGAKAIIFLQPFENISLDSEILTRELSLAGFSQEKIDETVENYLKEQKSEAIYQTQRSFVRSLLELITCDPEGKLRAKKIVDYWKKPEFLYLGPDENMHDSMIQWIAHESKKLHYIPGSAFISSKPHAGINHKHYGVTSLGVNVYVEALLNYRGIDPKSDEFTVKMSGGPDGDVAGNELLILSKNYPKTAKVIALIDVSGTIWDPKGLDLKVLANLFQEGQPIRHYPPALLSEGGFLLDKETRQHDNILSTQTLLSRKEGGVVVRKWLSGSDMNHLLKSHVHEVKADIFIPAGGRPRTLNENNVEDFLDATGEPSSELIVEGANLYITPTARSFLEDLGVLIVKDQSANKTGVICSSFEVLCGLTLGDERFIEHKEELVKEILERVELCARKEADLLIRTHKATDRPLTEISQKISERINQFKTQLMEHLNKLTLSKDPSDPLVRCYLDYALPLLREQFQKELLHNVAENHQKACIAAHIAANLVYKKGLSWFPSVVDILPYALKEISS